MIGSRTTVLWLLTHAAALLASASVVRMDATHTSEVGHGYQRLAGKVYFTVDPRHPANRGIVDISLAPRNGAGLVEFSADFEILRPSESTRSNRTLLFEVVNRGKRGMLQMFNRSKADDLGDGLLMKQGYTLVWLGWQQDVPDNPGLMRLNAPVIQGVTGLVRAEYTPNTPVERFPLGDTGHIAYKPTNVETVVLTVRDSIDGVRTPLPAGSWHLENGTHVRLSATAVPGKIYEVVYKAADPVLAGVALAGIRDFISHLRKKEDLQNAIAFGVSQSAMVLRAFLYEGFNQDEQGARVFDGVFAHVAGARRATFQRFTQPSRTAGPRRNASFSTTELPPYTDVELLARARRTHVEPKIFWTNSTYEYWGSGASLLHTTPDGLKDVPLPENARMYVFAGGQHGPASFPPAASGGVNLPNFNDYRWSVRALLGRLHDWVVNGAEPPASVYPTIAASTLVPLKQYSIKSVQTPKEIHTPGLLDFGSEYSSRGVIAMEPPRVVRQFRTLVPQADAEGNDLGGIQMPEVACPIAAYTGWNLRSESIGASGSLLGNTGSYLPFDVAKIQQKYSTKAKYLACVESAARSLVQRRLLLGNDMARLIDMASRHWSWRMDTQTTSAIQKD